MPEVQTTSIQQNKAGNTLDGYYLYHAFPVAPAGSTQADAKMLDQNLSVVTGADATKGVVLKPVTRDGWPSELYNATAAVLKVYPPVDGSINGGTVNAPVSLAGKTHARFISLDGLGNYAGNFTAAS